MNYFFYKTGNGITDIAFHSQNIEDANLYLAENPLSEMRKTNMSTIVFLRDIKSRTNPTTTFNFNQRLHS